MTRKMEEDYVKTSRKFHSFHNGVACFSCRVGQPPINAASHQQGLPVYLKVVCHCFPSVTLSPLLVSCTTET
jgi:hypothetical protein